MTLNRQAEEAAKAEKAFNHEESCGQQGRDDDKAGQGEAFRWWQRVCCCHRSQSYEKICGQAGQGEAQHKDKWFLRRDPQVHTEGPCQQAYRKGRSRQATPLDISDLQSAWTATKRRSR